MRSPIRCRFGLRWLLTFCLGTAILAANFTPRHHQVLELDAATLERIEHSCLSLNPADPVGPETVTDATTKGWPAMVYLTHWNPFSGIAAAISGNAEVTHESYVDGRGAAINAFVAAIVLIAFYLVPDAVSFTRRGRAIPKTKNM